MLERYGHGGDLKSAEESFGLPASSFLDFSSNMNPYGPPAAVFDALLHYKHDITNYPDPVSRSLRAKLAQRHGIEPDSILVGNGAAELIDLAVRALRPAKAAIAVPCFAEYGDAIRKSGAALYEGRLSAASGFQLDRSWVSAAIAESGASLYMLGSPNNPTGALIDPALIRELLESGATVIVDEAFMDFVPEEGRFSLLKEAAFRRNLLVLRSMTKFYSIPGIRLGYIVGHPEALAPLRALQVPWSVNSLAQSIGEAVLDDEEFARTSLAWLQEERPFLQRELQSFGLYVHESQTNYLLLRIPDELLMTAAALQREMGKKGVLIRDASKFPGLDDSYIRVAVKRREQNERLIGTLRTILTENGVSRNDRT
ncbi:threonine-phosphate decarboxylase CobD [Paenibacillus nanensis]|uniref:threonine-phosphate decarboxylase CobD n=1 Tax=Paenibacillus nanensis TaxID=393251 RepID=UPI0013C2FDC7|nr:threonine-phosphate decarboxylase CobD [Paenibacillus nanensis]